MGACAFNYEAIQIPSDEFSEGIAFVPKQIAGVSLLLREDGRPKLGAVHPLGPGTVELCGPGYNERTVRVRTNDGYYFVFREDLEQAPKRMSTASGK